MKKLLLIMILCPCVVFGQVSPKTCLKEGESFGGKLDYSIEIHPFNPGVKMNTVTVNLQKERCFILESKEKVITLTVQVIGSDDSDGNWNLLKQINKNRVVLKTDNFFEPETVYHKFPVIGNSPHVKEVHTSSKCNQLDDSEPITKVYSGQLYTVKSSNKRIPFYSEPKESCIGNLFIINGDKIKLIETKNNYSFVEYQSPSKVKFYGWIEDKNISK